MFRVPLDRTFPPLQEEGGSTSTRQVPQSKEVKTKGLITGTEVAKHQCQYIENLSLVGRSGSGPKPIPNISSLYENGSFLDEAQKPTHPPITIYKFTYTTPGVLPPKRLENYKTKLSMPGVYSKKPHLSSNIFAKVHSANFCSRGCRGTLPRETKVDQVLGGPRASPGSSHILSCHLIMEVASTSC